MSRLTSRRRPGKGARAEGSPRGSTSDGSKLDAAVRASGLLASLPDPTLIIGKDGRIVAASRGAETLFGYSQEEWIGLPLNELVPTRFRRWHAGLHAAYAAHPVARAMGAGLVLTALRKNGSEFPAEISLAPLASDGVTVAIAAIRDLTARNRANEERERDRRRFLERVITAQDDERRRIARELHDEAGQALASLIVRLRTLQDAGTLGEAKNQAARLRRSLADTIGGLARLARGLHPSLLDDLGLAPALKRHGADIGEALAIPVRVRIERLGTRRLPPPVETALYRIAQEALSNVARHARAAHVDVTLTRDGAGVHLTVSDDGRGFDPQTRKRGRGGPSLGLLGIRERAAAQGGAATIRSAAGRGTTVSVSLPLPARRAARRRRATRRASA